MGRANFKYLLFTTVFGLTACQNSSEPLQRLTTGTKNSLICEQNFDDFNNRIYEFWLEKKEAPEVGDFKLELEKFLANDPRWLKLDKKKIQAVVKVSTDYYSFLTTRLTKSVREPDEKLKLLTALEIGDSEDDRNALQSQWEKQKTLLKKQLKSIHLPCDSIPNHSLPNNGQQKLPRKDESTASLPRVIQGLRRAFATAYQSCRSLTLPALNNQTPDIEGIKILKEGHPDGKGRRRVYGDLEKIISTHPYYQSGVEQKNCIDTSKSPLIYDYGGKPHTTADNDSLLDFFTDDGSGTGVLGIDCSGFIFSAVARAGLNLAPNKALKAVSVHGIAARMFKDPVKNGLTCFAPIPIDATSSLNAGDIIASTGHVVMVDQVGEDPFGLRRATSLNDCNETILTTSGFNFVISHSSPWKEGVGINRSRVSDYLSSSESFSLGLTNYAIALCKARFNDPQQKIPLSNQVNIVRHKETPDCLTSKPIGLRHETCVSQCSITDPIESIN